MAESMNAASFSHGWSARITGLSSHLTGYRVVFAFDRLVEALIHTRHFLNKVIVDEQVF